MLGGVWLGVDISVHVCEDIRKMVTSTGCKTDFVAPWSERACKLSFSPKTCSDICLWNKFLHVILLSRGLPLGRMLGIVGIDNQCDAV